MRKRRRFEGDVEIYLKQILFEGLNWVCRAMERKQWRGVVSTAMNLLVMQELNLFNS
jgi:hypothetical protein